MSYKKQHTIILMLSLLTLTACSKSNEGPSLPLEDGVSIVVENLAGDVDASVGATGPGKEKRDFHTFLFRFSDKKQTWLKTAQDSANHFQKTDWDLAFSNYYNSSIYINNGEQSGVPFTENGSKHKMILLKQDYQKVTTAPSDAEFDSSTLYNIGMIIDEGSAGWYNYNMTSHLVQVAPNRTYVLRLSNGKYAKLQLINVYKNNPPVVTDLNWQAPYYTFRYFVQEDGSKNLRTQ
ncbi:HmuY family protein [Sphingobacterium sp.]|uniref:HmuY family protein n=1 Tax=Sphingobacterium sp. TaxID=341027 RepID=UPI0028A2C901|nr:HmuY family protein [Sphingobacterium sp.]